MTGGEILGHRNFFKLSQCQSHAHFTICKGFGKSYNTIRRYKQSVKFVALICVKFLLFQYLCGSEPSTGSRKADQTILIVAFVLSLVRGPARTTNIESVMKFAQLAAASRLVGVVSPACIRYNQALNQWCDGCKPQPASALTVSVTRVSENPESSPMCYMCSATQ